MSFLDEAFEPRLANFGLSKSVAEGHSQSPTIVAGTVCFMAPAIHEEAVYDWSVDVYAYGMLTYVTATDLGIFPGVKIEYQFITKIL
jgi:serine/threonine protein kinase